eukprot:Sro425_g140170.2  (501) ;mRNA; r:37933-39435
MTNELPPSAVTAANGSEALRKTERRTPDSIIPNHTETTDTPSPTVLREQNNRRPTVAVGAFAIAGIGVSPGIEEDWMDNSNEELSPPCELIDPVIDGAVLVDDETDNMEQGRAQTRRRHMEVIEGTIMPANQQPRNTRSTVGLAILCITALVVFLAVYLSSSSSGSHGSNFLNQTSRTTEDDPVTPTMYPPFQDGLPPNTLKAFQNTSTPEYLANAWMQNDPHLNSYSLKRQLQRYDLAWWYYITNGDNWYRNDHWLSYEVHECDWFTQAHNDSILHYDHYPVCDENNTIQILNLNSNNLQGTLPVINKFLPKLLTLDIGSNALHGRAPAGPAATANLLEVFIVSNNHFEGQLVSTGFKTFGLRVAKLDGNDLIGYLNPLFALLPRLEILHLSGNLYGGGLPNTIDGSTSLTSYKAADNLYAGTIPAAFGRIPGLETIDVHGNPGLTGQIPSEIGELSSLAFLDFTGTNVSGPVPDKLCERVQHGLMEIRANCSLVECCS